MSSPRALPERRRDAAVEKTKMVPPGERNHQQHGSIIVVPHHGGRQLSWYSHGGLGSQQMPQGLSVWVRLLLIGPGAGMRVAHASLPRFGALRRDNNPTPACLSIYIWGVHRTVQSAPRAVFGGSAMGIWLHICMHEACFSGRPCSWPYVCAWACLPVGMDG